MNTASNLVDLDDGPTLVMVRGAVHTEVMDARSVRPAQPASGVMPIAHRAPVTLTRPPIAYPPSADATQPALRVRRDLAGTRRLAIGLAIGLAFVFGIAASFSAQLALAGSSAPTSTRTPRTITERSSTLDTRSTPDVLLHASDDEPAASAKPARKLSPPVLLPPAELAKPESVEGRDLLGEGLGND
jgi:hypothetical protein